MCVGLVNDELQGHEREWMNFKLWYLPTEPDEMEGNSLCLCVGI